MPTTDTSGCSLGLLNEYRTRLIADVVTGKLDVREAAASLPMKQTDPKQWMTYCLSLTNRGAKNLQSSRSLYEH